MQAWEPFVCAGGAIRGGVRRTTIRSAIGRSASVWCRSPAASPLPVADWCWLPPCRAAVAHGEEYGELGLSRYLVSHGDPDLIEATRAASARNSPFDWQADVLILPGKHLNSILNRDLLTGPRACRLVGVLSRVEPWLRRTVPARRPDNADGKSRLDEARRCSSVAGKATNCRHGLSCSASGDVVRFARGIFVVLLISRRVSDGTGLVAASLPQIVSDAVSAVAVAEASRRAGTAVRNDVSFSGQLRPVRSVRPRRPPWNVTSAFTATRSAVRHREP